MKPVQVKICGITRSEDALAAAQLGAEFIGLNFYPRSPRCVSFERAAEILRVLPSSVQPIAVLVAGQPDEAEVRRRLRELGIDYLQIHAPTTPEGFDDGNRYLLAFSVGSADDLTPIQRFVQTLRASGGLITGVLLDAKVEGLHGGTGQTAPWHLLTGFEPGARLALAGGLTPDNVAEAIRIVQPIMVDVASGVESAPGIKDHDKMRRFIENAKS